MKTEDFYDHAHHNNKIVQFLVSRYFQTLERVLDGMCFKVFLDVGSGSSYVTNHVAEHLDAHPIGLDYMSRKLKFSQSEYPCVQLTKANGLYLPFADNSIELVISTEVLEHQENPGLMMEEIARVSKKYSIFSVPCEPKWRLSNIARGKYISDFGNTPGHVQHWSRNSFQDFLEQYFDNVHVESVYVWNIALCQHN